MSVEWEPVDGKPLSRFRTTKGNKMTLTVLQQNVIDALDGVIGANVAVAKTLRNLIDGHDYDSPEASTEVKAVGEYIRTFNGEVVAVDSLRKSKDAVRIKAVQRYDALSKAWLAYRATCKGKETANKKAAVKKIQILSTPKQFSGFAKAQIAALRKREKADFDLPKMIAAWGAVLKVAETK